MIVKKCLVCKKEFKTYNCHNCKFCSQKCYWKNLIGKSSLRKNGLIINCENCGKKFYRPKSHIKNKVFCSNRCYSLSIIGKPTWNKGKKLPQLSGKNASSWKGGKIKSAGYVFIYLPNHPFPTLNHKYIPEHRLVTEKCLNRYLLRQERVHHINFVRDDNRPENLYLFSSNGEHYKFHSLKNKPILQSNIV